VSRLLSAICSERHTEIRDRLHTSAQVGKSLVHAFYQKPHSKSYYLGCSLGGRQGIGSAEEFPGDFDGIVAGAPGVDSNNLISWRAHFFPITGAIGRSDFISADAWKRWIHDEVLRQCDLIDGVEDGIIEDPRLCAFNPSKLLCTGNATEGCLSKAQVRQVTQIYSDYKYPDGQIVYSAMQPGSEIGAATGLYAGAAWAYSEVSCFKVRWVAGPDSSRRTGSNTWSIMTLRGTQRYTVMTMHVQLKH
jgi:feruloyl esterase